MKNDNDSYLKLDYDEHAKTKAPDDFWGQVRRTVKGEPVSEYQIQMLVDAILSALNLSKDDMLLDIACGNGALSNLLFDSCAGYLGVDLSTHLINIAKANFEVLPGYKFAQQGAAEYVRLETDPKIFTKALCYGSFSYFSDDDATEVLTTLFEKFIHVETVFIGNLPDKDQASKFYKKPLNFAELSDCSSQIGIWRTRSEFTQLASNAGWNVKVLTMPEDFFASYYRYDALLIRKE